MQFLWVCIVIIAALLDIVTLDFLFFGISGAAAISLILSFYEVNVIFQLIIFGFLSFYGIFYIYPKIKKYVSNDK